jgi:proteasome lid subunit RPN8/RPN11
MESGSMTNPRILFGDPIEPELHTAELPFDQADNVFALPADEDFQVYFLKNIKEFIWEHVRTSPRLECSGILLGQPFQTANGKIKFILIVGAVEHNTSQRSVGHVTVGTSEIALARIESEKRYPDLIPVGWYHSHPGHGIFLSAQDMVIVRSIYNLPWHVALVIDPIRKTSGIFRGSEGEKMDGWLELNDDYNWTKWVINNLQKGSVTKEIGVSDEKINQMDADDMPQEAEAPQAMMSNSQTSINNDDVIQQEKELDGKVAEQDFQEALKLIEQGDVVSASRRLYTLQSKHPDYKPEEVRNLYEKLHSNPKDIHEIQYRDKSNGRSQY